MARRGDGIYRRGPTWWLDFTHRGERHVLRLGRGITKTVARELAHVQRSAILRGEAGIGGPERKDIAFEKAAAEFLAWVVTNRRPKTATSYRECVTALTRSFAGRRLSDIHPFAIEKHKRTRIEGGAPVAANRELAVLKALINRHRDWGHFDGDNPVRKVKPTKERKGRLRYLEPEEEAALVAVTTEPLRTIILAGVHAGLRVKSEALTLRREDVDLRRGLLTVQAAYAKSGETRTVPLNSVLREALQRLAERAGESAYIFAKADGSPYRSVKSTFKAACARAGLKDVTPHTLRHTFASRLAMAGVDLRTIQELGGWATLHMVERYAHLSPKHKADAVERIAQNSTTLFTTQGADRGALRAVTA